MGREMEVSMQGPPVKCQLPVQAAQYVKQPVTHVLVPCLPFLHFLALSSGEGPVLLHPTTALWPFSFPSVLLVTKKGEMPSAS